MPKFQLQETVVNEYDESFTVRFGVTGSSGQITDKEVGKFAKLAAPSGSGNDLKGSQYTLCAAGDPIEAIVLAVESATQDGYSIASVVDTGLKRVKFDGLQATPGTGTIVLGDYVVCGTVVAKGTSLGTDVAKVCKATNQPGTAFVSTVATADTAAAVKVKLDLALVAVADADKNAMFAWRVESFETDGAVGSYGIIRRVNC